ncbi:MAG: terminase family protein [Candidatus Babeliales bacterium]
MTIPDDRVIWKPQSGPQEAALLCPAFDLLFGGARGGGKSDFVVGEFAVHAEQDGVAARGILLRKTYPQLNEIIHRSKQIYGKLGAQWHEAKKEWVFGNGATLLMRHLENESDAENYMGFGLSRVYVDEMGNFADPSPLDKLKASLRSAKGVAVKFRATANPGGPGHHWIKSRYIDPAPLGYKFLDDGAGNSRMYIPSRVFDNKILLDNDPTYIARLKSVGSPELIRAWLDGDWDVVQGAYFPEFRRDLHVVEPERLPVDWLRYMAIDWGSAKPFWVGWFAVADGSYGVYPKGALICYKEWYGGKDNVGIKLTAEDFARGIIGKSMPGEARFTVMDPSTFKQDGGPSIAERMWRCGVKSRPADNSRLAGWDQVRARLKGEDGKPMLYISAVCVDLIRTLPALQHDDKKPEDADSTGDDHACDGLRYACMARPWIVKVPKAEDIAPRLLSFGEAFPLKPKAREKRV